jgi:hypothetical protein
VPEGAYRTNRSGIMGRARLSISGLAAALGNDDVRRVEFA